VTAVTFTVPGVPIGKGRPRVSTFAGRARMYTPAKTASYEGLIAHEARLAMDGQTLMLGAVQVVLDIAVPVPASWSKKKQAAALAGTVRPTGKPDIDNTAKAIFDGINQVVWRDDSQVVSVTATKRYSEVPGVAVHVTELNMEAPNV
jgi:Holliday junction resolvase RusA-like endonuclease